MVEIPSEYVLDSSDPEDLIKKIYPDFIKKYTDINYIKERVIISPLNVDVWTINKELNKLINSPEKH
jgi:hypothetical protein